MAYRRSGVRTWSFEAHTRTGHKQLATGVTSKPLAQRIEAMWSRLANEFRAWDLLDPVLTGQRDLRTLFDLWEQADHKVHEVRRLLADGDLAPAVAEWFAVYSRKHPDTDSPAHALAHVRYLLPEN